MKRILLSSILLAASQLFAITHTITVSGFSFSPSELEVEIGDVIEWQWESGSHTTTSRNIPTNAASWDAPLNSASQSFNYTITEIGTYTYVCKPHEGMGMVASITATIATSLSTADLNEGQVFPNPFQNSLIIDNADYSKGQFFSTTGNLVKEVSIYDGEIKTNDLKKGVYLLLLFTNEDSNKILRVVKE